MSNIDKRDIISRITIDVECYYTNKIEMYELFQKVWTGKMKTVNLLDLHNWQKY
jgi:hypothetical protein